MGALGRVARMVVLGVLVLVAPSFAENLNPQSMSAADRQALVDEIEYVRFLLADYMIGFNWQDGFRWDPEKPVTIPDSAVEWNSFGFFRGGGWRLKSHERHADLELRIEKESRFLGPLGIQEPLMIFVDRFKGKFVEDKFRPSDDKKALALEAVTRTFRSTMALLDSVEAPYLGRGVVIRPRDPGADAPAAEVVASAPMSLLGTTSTH